MVTCPDHDQGVKSDFANKMRKPMRTIGSEKSKEFVVAKSDYTLLLKSEEIIQLICCCVIRIHLVGDWVNNDQVKQSNIKTSPSCVVAGTAPPLLTAAALMMCGAGASPIQRIGNGAEFEMVVMQSLLAVVVWNNKF